MSRPGAILLEVLVAVTILGVVAASSLSFAVEGASRVRSNRATESELRSASVLLDAVTLWSSEDLNLHLGRRRQGIWTMEIQRVQENLYDVTLEERPSGRLLLRTSLYRVASQP